jgi:hypothetical protein
VNLTIAGKTVSLAAIVAAVGGLLAIVGAFLAWASLTVGAGMAQVLGSHSDGKGVDETAGKVALLLGIVVIALVAAWILQLKVPMIPVLVAVVGALIIVVMALTFFTSILSQGSLKDALDTANKTIDQAKAAGMDTAGTSAGPGLGFILEIVAGVLVIAGGAWAQLKKA